MKKATDKKQLQKITQDWRSKNQKIGFVPTMGALHEGHLSLIEIAKKNADKVVVSIFVNPEQFAPHEDFDSYPRDIDSDLKKLKQHGVDLVYFPSRGNMYDEDFTTRFNIGGPNIGLDSDHRPHFFNGVAAVVCKLFNQIRPNIAVFGEKDYQQLMVIRQMVKDLDMDVRIIGAPLMRDENGLALSSRNQYLTEKEYKIAAGLNKVLFSLAEEMRNYPDETEELIRAGIASIYELGFDQVDYLEIRWNRILTAGWVGKTRLLDNVPIEK